MSIPESIFARTLSAYFEPIRPLLDDAAVTEVLINRYDEIYVERNGQLERSSRSFVSELALMSALRNLSQYVGRGLGPDQPILEARLPDGSRVEALVPPVSPAGPIAAIRCFRDEPFAIEQFVGAGGSRVIELLRAMVAGRKNVLVSGGSGAGKTSLLGALVSLTPPAERVIVIEDSLELRLGAPHLVRMESRLRNESGRCSVSIRDLLRAALRMRPDRIIVGEVRSKEALDLVQAMISGHRGCLSTIHATLPGDALSRLETMALMSDVELPVSVIRRQIASAIDVVVQLARGDRGTRRVTHFAEVQGVDIELGYELEYLVELEEQR